MFVLLNYMHLCHDICHHCNIQCSNHKSHQKVSNNGAFSSIHERIPTPRRPRLLLEELESSDAVESTPTAILLFCHIPVPHFYTMICDIINSDTLLAFRVGFRNHDGFALGYLQFTVVSIGKEVAIL